MFNGKFLIVATLALLAVLMFGYFYFRMPTGPKSGPIAAETDEQKIMHDIGPNATEEQQKEYFQIARRLAQETENITIKDCKGSPTVFKATPGKKVSVVNQDPTNHQITMDSAKYKYPLTANSTTEIEFDFFRGKGFYSYGCDRITGPAGILFVAE